ncbi:MAG: hypothetical protein KL787_05170 [Taibaiella sp.]|nr:hypothetical protein [Taibaiella sp.]
MHISISTFNPVLLQFLLDKYKNIIYTIYKKLNGLHKDLELVVHHGGKATTDEEVKNLIAASEWQTTHHHIETPGTVTPDPALTDSLRFDPCNRRGTPSGDIRDSSGS